MRNTVLLAAAVLLMVLASLFPDERDRFFDSLFNGSQESDPEVALLTPPSQPFVCSEDFISFYSTEILSGPVHLRRSSVEQLSFTELGIEIITTSGEWMLVDVEQYRDITHCLILGPAGLDPSYLHCEHSIVRPCLGEIVEDAFGNRLD